MVLEGRQIVLNSPRSSKLLSIFHNLTIRSLHIVRRVEIETTTKTLGYAKVLAFDLKKNVHMMEAATIIKYTGYFDSIGISDNN